ncbi:MAG: hypothetical protein IJ088_12760 [Clostridia bacterium]|nr:hypothetical protein [Clostridia bacterium]
MNRTIETLQIILPVIITLGLGMLCRRKHLLSREGVDTLKFVAVNIGLPAVLLHTFAATRYTVMDLVIPLMMYMLCIAAYCLGKVLGRCFKMNNTFIPFLTTGFEAGMLGYALFTLLYGSERTAEFARIDLGQVLFVFTLYKVLLAVKEDEKADTGKLLRDMVFSPIIWAIAAGVLLGATGIYRSLQPSGISALLDRCTDFISAPVSSLILLSIGYDLVLEDIPWRETVSVLGLRLLIMTVLGGLFLTVLHLFRIEPRLNSAVYLMFLLPPPFVLPVFAKSTEQRVFLSSVLSLSTLVSIIGFIVLAVTGL